MNAKAPPNFADYDIWPCICSAKQLLHEKGCTCGAWAGAVRDYQVAKFKYDQTAREERRKLRDFLIRAPSRPITFRPLCHRCRHPLHAAECDEPDCFCGQ